MTITNPVDFETLMRVYADAKARAESAKDTMEQLRQILMPHVKTAGGYLTADGVGVARIMPESLTVGYDTKAIDEIVHQLIQAGESVLAHKISTARRSTKRKSYLRIDVSEATNADSDAE